MIKSYVITINEVDDPQDAVVLIREKMSEIKLLSNSFGIISTHSDAIYSGVYKAVCDVLPFPVAGIAVEAQNANGEIETYILSIMILTTDDCNFVCGRSENTFTTNDSTSVVKECYLSLKNKLDEKPKLALLYTPFMVSHFPGEYINAISSIEPSLPIFGAVSADLKALVEPAREGVLTLCDGSASDESVVIVLISGEIAPKFFVSSFGNEAIKMKNIGVVTKSEKNILSEIDNINATEFLKKVGYFGESENPEIDAGHITATCVLDYGTQDCSDDCDVKCPAKKQLVSRAPAEYTDKGVICLGHIGEGASVSIALSTPESVIQSAKEIVKMLGESGAQTALMYSCLGRRVGLLTNPMKEFETIKSKLSDSINYTVSYVGGEICPTCVLSDKALNHEHNQTLIACVF